MTFAVWISIGLFALASILGTLFMIGLCRMNDDLDHDRELGE